MKHIKSFVGISNNFKNIVLIFFIVLFFAYFIYHVINGRNGILSYIEIRSELLKKESVLLGLKNEYETISRRTNLLSNKNIDADILEERSKAILGYAYKDELVLRD